MPGEAGTASTDDFAVDPDTRPITRRRFLSMTLGAGFGLASVTETLLYLSGRNHYRTDIGEMGHVLLPDGSMAILNTATEIDHAFSSSHRRVKLLRGEALFDVEQDLARQFSVEASGLLIQTHGVVHPQRDSPSYVRLGALIDYGRDIARPLTQRPSRAGFEARGTTFVVRIKPGCKVEGAILAGVVELLGRAPLQFEVRTLGANTVLTTEHSVAPQTREIDTRSLEAKLAWLDRRVTFVSGTTVGQAASEINRYNALRIVVEGGLANVAIRGSFFVDRPLDFVRTLARLTNGTVHVSDRVVTIWSDRLGRG